MSKQKILKIKHIELMIDKINKDLIQNDEAIYNIENLLEMAGLDISLIEVSGDIMDLIANNKLLSWHGIIRTILSDEVIAFSKPEREKQTVENIFNKGYSNSSIGDIIGTLFDFYHK